VAAARFNAKGPFHWGVLETSVIARVADNPRGDCAAHHSDSGKNFGGIQRVAENPPLREDFY
jgi:hypothetical protein